jgi:hypothetical protein
MSGVDEATGKEKLPGGVCATGSPARAFDIEFAGAAARFPGCGRDDEYHLAAAVAVTARTTAAASFAANRRWL